MSRTADSTDDGKNNKVKRDIQNHYGIHVQLDDTKVDSKAEISLKLEVRWKFVSKSWRRRSLGQRSEHDVVFTRHFFAESSSAPLP